MRWIYLSPHLDDAILSCGGLIYHQSQNVTAIEIWNLMSGMPSANAALSDLALSVQADWGTDTAKETLIMRLTEDRLATQRAGAMPRYFDFLDCIYRHDADGEPLYTEDLFAGEFPAPPHPADDALIKRIALDLQENLLKGDVLVCPLTIGKHPDHLIVRQAAERTGHPLMYYADIPYALEHPEQHAEMTENLSAREYPIPEGEMQIWQEAVAAYESQNAVLFGGEEMMKDAIRQYWSATRITQLYHQTSCKSPFLTLL